MNLHLCNAIWNLINYKHLQSKCAAEVIIISNYLILSNYHKQAFKKNTENDIVKQCVPKLLFDTDRIVIENCFYGSVYVSLC